MSGNVGHVVHPDTAELTRLIGEAEHFFEAILRDQHISKDRCRAWLEEAEEVIGAKIPQPDKGETS